jgi:hypothetical protein
MTHTEALEVVRKMLENEPDLNLYLLAFEQPELEDAALEIAREAD